MMATIITNEVAGNRMTFAMRLPKNAQYSRDRDASRGFHNGPEYFADSKSRPWPSLSASLPGNSLDTGASSTDTLPFISEWVLRQLGISLGHDTGANVSSPNQRLSQSTTPVIRPNGRMPSPDQGLSQSLAASRIVTIYSAPGVPSTLPQTVPPPFTYERSTVPEPSLHPAVHEFAQGLDGILPAPDVVVMAARIVSAAHAFTAEPEISVDDDGALSVDLRLSNGLRLLSELPIAGTLDVGVYDDRDTSRRAQEVVYLPSATADELISLL